jgi:PPM family protein phosphatase
LYNVVSHFLSVPTQFEEEVSAEQIAKWLARPLRPFSITEAAELGATVGTTIGEVRQDNQDRAVIARFTSLRRPKESFVCFALCDGMGGLADGGRCAETALSSFILRLTRDANRPVPELLRLAALAANADVYRQFRERGGTTLAAIVIFPGAAAAVSVGDSRIYAISKREGLKQVTIDDTIAGELNQLKGFTSHNSDWSSFASQLAQFIGLGEEIKPRTYSIEATSAYLITSDGTHSIEPTTMNQIVITAGTPPKIVPRLLQVSRWCGGSDNATAVCTSQTDADFFFTRPAWGEGDWLEIWDSVGKAEFPVLPSSTPFARPVESRNREATSDTKTAKRSKKRTPAANKKQPDTDRRDAPPPMRQRTLEIEIVDEAPEKEATQKPETIRQTNSEGLPLDDPATKRD